MLSLTIYIMLKKYHTLILISILLLAAFLRLTAISSGDPLTDEVGYAFRSVGLLDFDEAGDQTTPLEWFDPDIPSWTKLSFHDHPPLVFWVQHAFITVFGERNFAFRFPSALLGIASVYILYLIGRRLYDDDAGLLAAGIFAVTVNPVTISRLGLQEAYVMFFLLLSYYVFIRARENKSYLTVLGAILGLAFLTKYTLFVLIPIFGSYLLLFHRDYLWSRQLWIGAGIGTIIFSPVLLYNYHLWKTVGHFDFQLSYIFGQHPAVWQIAPGKEQFPTINARLASFVPNTIGFNSWIFLSMFAVSIMGFLFTCKKNCVEILRKHTLLLLSFGWILLLIIGLIGPSLRFISFLTPFMALGIAYFLSTAIRKSNFRIGMRVGIISVFLLIEFLYSVNTQLISYPYGAKLWTFSQSRFDNYAWGYNELNAYITKELDGRMPAFAFESQYAFISEIHKKSLTEAERAGKEPYPLLILYDRNIQSMGQLWILDRLQIYHAWPVIPIDQYLSFLSEQGPDLFDRVGVTKTIIIIPAEGIPLKTQKFLTPVGRNFENQLHASGIMPTRIIANKRGNEAFRIYELTN
ncbi:MAG: hypothetical protein COU90_03175 [Candidatus Ryanbacteria bacterium CG10_big_fil_rev_8_21_14_0_10_43_42]|uniref:Glycosyltransferase RgtA/B/C/D-like domain-containing protein n=1 Tax=Candidatus Ryanbacteria bacterium CG10_big_fil_rev_8_21_14_0_10_43_42 TaxID=1974864 RepID=A0A2M8KX11_9BACT|nr:MAG: hypothetical protein COU90_03175 [Candidatus Ryanbacteria bacterium CG10_big_fil_rev_8_21_14_0_10_43_42]